MATEASHPPGLEHETRGPMFIIVEAVMLAVVIIAVALRMISKYRTKQTAIEDWLIFAAGIMHCAYAAITFHATLHFDWGKHTWAVRPKSRSTLWREWGYHSTLKLLFPWITSFVRISVSLFLKRLNPYSQMRVFIRYWVGINIFALVAYTFIVFFRCIPPSESFKPSARHRIASAKCWDDVQRGYVVTSTQLFLDVVTWLLPAIIVVKVNTTIGKKLQMAALLMIGFLSVATAGLRMAMTVYMPKSKDPYWDTVIVHLSFTLEGAVGIVTASVPAIKRLFDDFSEKIALGSEPSQAPSSPLFALAEDRERLSKPDRRSKEVVGV